MGSTYPTIYCPDGMAKPPCCAHAAPMRVLAGKGPDNHPKGGNLWGSPVAQGQWKKTVAGWWILEEGHFPQHLARVETHPRIIRWMAVRGAEVGHWWRVPVFLVPAGQPDQHLWCTALDRIFDGAGYSIPQDFQGIQEKLLYFASGTLFGGDTPEERDLACVLLAAEILAIGQWVDPALLASKAWLTERVASDVITAALGVDPEESGADV